ncbi:GGDEF domain-containing protein [Sphingomicrobium flavum]|uniref:GGDEF domain-containing protein n=1 Tax=Sphingomicrobium flavum TaxID=1229164 RepID=UPI0021AE2919|nr:GGDEF domain-containing protein [Sphingomicrobium flavum]
MGDNLFFYLVPIMFILFGIALGAVALADRKLVAARYGALGFSLAAVGILIDAFRTVDDHVLQYLALLAHFATLGLMVQAFAVRHERQMPMATLAVLGLGAFAYLPGTPLDAWPHLRVILVQLIAATALFPFIIIAIGWAQRSTVDRIILFAISLSFLSYVVRAGIFAGNPAFALDWGPNAFNVYNVIFHISTAMTGFATALVLLVAVGVDALVREARESETDALTGIGNRRALDAAIDADMRGEWRCGAVIAADLDHFKQVNDRYGHAGGDRVLVAVGETLQRVLGQFGRLCRIGGEEFVLLVDDDHADAAEALATTTRKAIAAIRLDGPLAELRPTACVGFHIRGEGASIAEALNSADRAVYRGKADGRNKVVSAVGEPGAIALRAV